MPNKAQEKKKIRKKHNIIKISNTTKNIKLMSSVQQ